MSLWVVRLGTPSAASLYSANSRLALLLTILVLVPGAFVARAVDYRRGGFPHRCPLQLEGRVRHDAALRTIQAGKVQLFVPALETLRIDLLIDPSRSIRVTNRIANFRQLDRRDARTIVPRTLQLAGAFAEQGASLFFLLRFAGGYSAVSLGAYGIPG